MESEIITSHAPAKRISELELRRQASLIQNNTLVMQAFNAVNAIVLIVNKQRQIVFANKCFLNVLQLKSLSPLLGKRPGEVLNCIHAEDNLSGCGTSEACRYCNGVNLVLQTISNKEEADGEVIFNTKGKEFMIPMDFFENVSPLVMEGQEFFVITLRDISDTKRRRLLERVFFHDIINSVGGLHGLVSILNEELPDALKPEGEYIESGLAILVDEILFHKKLQEAENNELVCDFRPLKSDHVLAMVVKLYENHDVAKNKNILISADSSSAGFRSDLMLLSKVIGNMIKNALEHTVTGGTVTVGCKSAEGHIEFWVHNDHFIPIDVQYHIFQLNFSTKGRGRGIGTYSIKLFVEKYLKGQVNFTTDEEKGTTFNLRLAFDVHAGIIS